MCILSFCLSFLSLSLSLIFLFVFITKQSHTIFFCCHNIVAKGLIKEGWSLFTQRFHVGKNLSCTHLSTRKFNAAEGGVLYLWAVMLSFFRSAFKFQLHLSANWQCSSTCAAISAIKCLDFLSSLISQLSFFFC